MVEFCNFRKNNPRDRKKILEIKLNFFYFLKKQTWFDDEK